MLCLVPNTVNALLVCYLVCDYQLVQFMYLMGNNAADFDSSMAVLDQLVKTADS